MRSRTGERMRFCLRKSRFWQYPLPIRNRPCRWRRQRSWRRRHIPSPSLRILRVVCGLCVLFLYYMISCPPILNTSRIQNYLSPLFHSSNESAKINVKDGKLRVKNAKRSFNCFLTTFSIIKLRSD